MNCFATTNEILLLIIREVHKIMGTKSIKEQNSITSVVQIGFVQWQVTVQEATLLVPADPVFEKVARECVDAGVAVDLFLFPHTYVDLASLGKIPSATGRRDTEVPHVQSRRGRREIYTGF